jgi:hypothetical protein
MSTSNNDSKPASTNSETVTGSQTEPTGKRQDKPQDSASTWIGNAIRGIQEMNESESARKEVANRLF